MPWYIFPLISAVLLAASTIFEKKILHNEHATEFSTVFAIFNAILCIPFFFFADFSKLTMGLVFIIYVASVMATVTFLLCTKSNRHMEVSASSPWMILAPAFAAIMAFIFLGEKLSSIQYIGLSFMVVGLYVLQTHKHTSLLEPFREIYSSKYIHYIILSLFLYSFGALIDRLILNRNEVSVFAYLFLIHLFVAINFSIITFFRYDGVKGIKHGIKFYGWLILLVSILTVTHRVTTSIAISTTMIGLVLPIKRLSSLFTTIIGGELFHEKNLARKIIACLIMLVGVIFIIQ